MTPRKRTAKAKRAGVGPVAADAVLELELDPHTQRVEYDVERDEYVVVDLTEAEQADVLEREQAAVAAAAASEAAGANADTLRDRLVTLAGQLKTAADAASASPPTLFAALPNAERQTLVRLLRAQLAMIRLQLQLLDATD